MTQDPTDVCTCTHIRCGHLYSGECTTPGCRCPQFVKASPTSTISHGGTTMRTFATGANRSSDAGKLDFDGFLSPLALEAFAQYMHQNRVQADGQLRASDNWQAGIPIEAYMKSLWRHFFAVWKHYRGNGVMEVGSVNIEDLCAMWFNMQGLIHEAVKANLAKSNGAEQ